MADLNAAIVDCIDRSDVEGLSKVLKGRNVNATVDRKWPPLLHACILGKDSIVEYLLQQGAAADCESELFTPLMAVCNSDAHDKEALVNCARYILERGVDPDAMDKYKTTALMYACTKGHEALVSLLLDAKCDVNKFDNEGFTALHSACMYTHSNIVKLLLEHGVEKNIKDRRGRTPLDLAVAKGADDIIELLSGSVLVEVESRKQKTYVRKESPFEKLLAQLPSYNDNSGKIGFFNDIETLLSGMGAGMSNKANLFLEKNVSLAEFLNIKDDDLNKLGVHFSSQREKIIVGNKRFLIHPWAPGSVHEFKNNTVIDIMDIIRSLANCTKQLHIIWATSVYCNDRVTLPSDNNDPNVDKLFRAVLEVRKTLAALINELSLIQEKAEGLDESHPVAVADLVVPTKRSRFVSSKKIFIVSAFCALVAWKANLISIFKK